VDRALLSDKDIDALLAWRDAHQDLVRTMPAPLKGIDIVCTDRNGTTIKGIRKTETSLRLYLTIGRKNRGYVEFINLYAWRWVKTKDTLDRGPKEFRLSDELMEETTKSMLTIYASLMALMVYGNEGREYTQSASPLPRNAQPAAPRKGKSKPRPGLTYILRSDSHGIRTAIQGTRTSPQGVFSVRGHYRHYKSGKVVWIAEYRKGEGKKTKRKTYKIGGGTPA